MKSVKQTERVYYGLGFLFWFGNALPLALLILLLQSRGLSLLQVSLLFGINSLTVVLLEVPTGSLADIVGRKRVAIWAAMFSVATFVLFLFAFPFWLLLLGGLLMGVGRALDSGTLDAWFVDTLQGLEPEIDLQPFFAKSGVVILLGLASGTLFGSVLPRWFAFLPPEGSAVLTPFSTTLVATLLIHLVRLALLWTWVQEDRPKSTLSLRQSVATVPAFVREAVALSRESRIIRWLLLTTFLAGFVMLSLENFWQPFFSGLLGGSEGNSVTFGVIMAGNFVLGAVGNIVSPMLAKRLNQRLGLLAGLFELLRGVFLILLVFQTSVYTAVLWFWLIYFGMGGANSPVAVILNSEISAEKRSSMLSIQSMVGYLGFFSGSVVLGFIAEQFSIETAWIVGGCVLLVSFIPYLQIDRLYTAKQTHHAAQNPQLETVQEADAG